MTNIVEFTPTKLKRLKAAWVRAAARKEEHFTFDGNEYDVNYAKYLIEYLEGRMGKGVRS